MVVSFSFQAQLVVLSAQVVWSESCETALQQIEKSGSEDTGPMENVLKIVEATLNVLADSVLQEQPQVRRKKLEHLVSVSFGFLFYFTSKTGE